MASKESSLILICIIIALTYSPIFGQKVRERWSGVSKNLTLRVVLPSMQKGTLQKATMPANAQQMCDEIFAPFADWDTVEQLGMDLGHWNETTGEWNGVIGAVTSGRGDFILQNVNPNMFDSRYDIPGHIGPIAYDGQLAILSAGEARAQHTSTLLAFFQYAVEGEFYFYSIVWTIVFMTSYTIIVIILWKRDSPSQSRKTRKRVSIEVNDDPPPNEPKSDLKIVFMTLISCVWMVAEIFVLTETHSKLPFKIKKTRSLFILTSALILCVYYAFDLVIWGMLSGELAVETPPKFIDSISDLINGAGFNMTPVILTDFGAFEHLSVSTNQDEHNLYHHIMKFPEQKSRMSFNGEGVDSMSGVGGIMVDIQEKRIAFIERLFSFSFVPHLCFWKPDIMTSLHISRDTFGGGYFTFFYGNHLPPGSISDLDFHLTNIIEMGFFIKGMIQNIVPELYFKSDLMNDPRAGFLCQEKVIEMVENDPRYDPQEVNSFDIAKLFQVFLILASGLFLAGCIMIIERLVFYRKHIRPYISRKRNQTKHCIILVFKLLNPLTSGIYVISQICSFMKAILCMSKYSAPNTEGRRVRYRKTIRMRTAFSTAFVSSNNNAIRPTDAET